MLRHSPVYAECAAIPKASPQMSGGEGVWPLEQGRRRTTSAVREGPGRRLTNGAMNGDGGGRVDV